MRRLGRGIKGRGQMGRQGMALQALARRKVVQTAVALARRSIKPEHFTREVYPPDVRPAAGESVVEPGYHEDADFQAHENGPVDPTINTGGYVARGKHNHDYTYQSVRATRAKATADDDYEDPWENLEEGPNPNAPFNRPEMRMVTWDWKDDYTEGRVHPSMIEVWVRYSTDAGATWSEPRMVAVARPNQNQIFYVADRRWNFDEAQGTVATTEARLNIRNHDRSGKNKVLRSDFDGLLDRDFLPTGPDIWYAGSGSPEGVLAKPVGSGYLDTTNGDAYVKATGVGNTGWAYLYRAGGTDVAVADGGTGASTASGARTNLGAAPLDPQFVTLATNGELSNERVLTPESGVLLLTDGGAGGLLTISVVGNGIANAKLAQMAQATVKGRAAGAGTGDATDLTATEVAAIIAALADPIPQYQKESEREAANGYAGLDASQLVIRNPANATATPTAGKIPIADGSGLLDSWISGAAPTGAAGGDLSGTYPNPTVARVAGVTPGAGGLAILDDASVAAIRTTLGLGTADSPEFTALNVGHASDTTITRTGSGDIAVEGNLVYRAGGTDVPITDGGTGASTAANARTNLGLAIGSDVQAFDPELAAIAGLTSAADQLPYFTGSGTAALVGLSAFIRTLLPASDAAAARSTLGVVIGTDVQAQDAELAAIAGLVSAADRLPYFTGSGTASLATFTAFARTLAAAATQGDARTALGLGTGDSPQFTGVEVGHASDTTLTRASAGDLAVEGNALYRAGGTDVPIADGGTGASTAPSARDNLGLIFHREVADQTVGNTTTETSIVNAGAGLSIPANTLSTNRVVELMIEGIYVNNTGVNRNLTIRVYYGTTEMIDFTISNIATSASTRSFGIKVRLFGDGSTSAQEATAELLMSTAGSPATGVGGFGPGASGRLRGTAAEDSTGALDLDVTVEHSTNLSTLTLTVEKVYAKNE